jgi:alpha-tubulin suppressor-like RCC1 family protein
MRAFNAFLFLLTVCFSIPLFADICPTAIAGGAIHVIALKSDSTAWAWGRNDYGALGDGSTTNSAIPVQVKGPSGVGFLRDIIAIDGGGLFTAALKSDGTVWTWGLNNYGELGVGDTISRTTPVQVLGPDGIGYFNGVNAIKCGAGYSIALKSDSTVWTWGANLTGTLGVGDFINRTTPVQVLGPGGIGFLTDVIAIAGGTFHAVALKSDGTVWAWGSNGNGELGDGTFIGRQTPVQVFGSGGVGFLTNVTAIEGGGDYTIALKVDGTVYTCGNNNYGQLGDGTHSSRRWPVQVVGSDSVGVLTDIISIASGGQHTIALKADSTIWTWGRNYDGELGYGIIDTVGFGSSVPVHVVGPGGIGFLSNIIKIAGGNWSGYGGTTIALKADGSVWVWGNNGYGQFGNGTIGGSSGIPIPADMFCETNLPPIFTSCPDSFNLIAGNGYMFYSPPFDLEATDPNDDLCSFSILDYPLPFEGFWRDSSHVYPGWAYLWPVFYPSTTDTGLFHFSYAICDSHGLCDTCSFVVHVLPDTTTPITNHAPIITGCPIDTIIIDAGDSLFLDYIGASDPDSEDLTIGLFDFPAPYRGWWYDSLACWPSPYFECEVWFDFNPTLADTGIFSFAFDVCDSHGLCDTCSFVVHVLPDTTSPSCPSIADFVVVTTTSHSISLAWGYASDSPDSIFLWRIEGSDTVLIASLLGSVLTFTDSLLPYATSFGYYAEIFSEGLGICDSAFISTATSYFKREPDGFSFRNASGEIWPMGDAPSYPFPDWQTFVVGYGADQVLDPYGVPRPAAQSFYNSIRGSWGGSCFGFSCVSLHLFGETDPYNISDWSVPNTISIPRTDAIKRFINAEMIRQPYYSTYLGGGIIPGLYSRTYYPNPSSATNLINDICANMVNDLQKLCFFTYGWGGHSIVPYLLDTLSSTEYRLYCYDNWSAYHDFYYDISTSTGSIIYHRTYGSPASQPINYIQLLPSRPFAVPPIMDFYGSGSRESAFAGTGKGFFSLKAKNLTLNDSSFFSIDMLYEGAEDYILLIPSDTVGGPTTPNWALQIPANPFLITLTGDSTVGANGLLTTIHRLFTYDFPEFISADTLKISLTSGADFSLCANREQTAMINIHALLNTTLKDEGLYSLQFSAISCSTTFDVSLAESLAMKVDLGYYGADSTSYEIKALFTDYGDTLGIEDTILFPVTIPLKSGEHQIIDFNGFGINGWDGFIARDINGDWIYEDTIWAVSGIYERTTPRDLTLNIIPNPFNETVTIISPANAKVVIFDVNGKEIAEIPSGRFNWKPNANTSSGIYFVKASLAGKVITKRVVYLK